MGSGAGSECCWKECLRAASGGGAETGGVVTCARQRGWSQNEQSEAGLKAVRVREGRTGGCSQALPLSAQLEGVFAGEWRVVVVRGAMKDVRVVGQCRGVCERVDGWPLLVLR